MAAVDDQPRSGVNRRDALRMLAATTTTVAAGTLIISQPAHAAIGSETCGPLMMPQAVVELINQSGTAPKKPDYLSISVAPNASCPCGETKIIEYAYSVAINPSLGFSTGWITSPAISVARPGMWGNGGGTATVGVWARIACGLQTTCRMGAGPGSVGGPNERARLVVDLSDNGNCSPGAPSGTLQWASGTGNRPTLDLTAANAPTELAPIEPVTTTTTDNPGNGPQSSDSTTATTTTTAADTTTTTDKPGNGPQAKQADSTSTTTPTTTTTTTTPSSTTLPPG